MSDLLSYIFRNRNGRVIFSESPNLPMIPASNEKIVTGFVSFLLLGHNFEILTEFKLNGKELIVSGGPCPLLRTPEAENISSILEEYKVNRALFNRGFDEDLYAPAWHSENQNECYQTRVTSFSLNENCVSRLRIKEEKRSDEPHSGKTIPDIRPYDTLSKKLVSDGARDVFPSYDFTNSDGGKLIYTHRERLDEILQHLEPISCNFSADSLFKFIHHFKTGKLGSWRGGSEAVNEVLSILNLLEPGMKIVDGSGLSSLNRLTPSFLSRLIRAAREMDGGRFLEYFPSPGTGTLKKRLHEFEEYGIKAKTGSLNGVATLSGYITKLDVTFSIMLNNSEKKGKEARDVIDDTLTDIIYKLEKKG